MKLACKSITPVTRELANKLGLPVGVANHVISVFMQNNGIVMESEVNPELLANYWNKSQAEQRKQMITTPEYTRFYSEDIVDVENDTIGTSITPTGSIELVAPRDNDLKMQALAKYREQIKDIPGALDTINTFADACLHALYTTSLDEEVGGSPADNSTQAVEMVKGYQQLMSITSPTTSIEQVQSAQKKTIQYSPAGKNRQTYTIEGNKIFNKDGKEVFKEDSIDRNKIFANLAVQEGRAVVVDYKGAQYVVNKEGKIISVTSGKIMQWGEENGNRKNIVAYAEDIFFTKSLASSGPIKQASAPWTRQEAQSHPETLYLFTDNTDRDSGSGIIPSTSRYAQKYGEGKHFPTRTQAVLRGLDNAMPISTQRWYHAGATGKNGVWTDNDAEEFRRVIHQEIDDIIAEWKTDKYQNIMIGDGSGFFNGNISNISEERVPQLRQILKEELKRLHSAVSSTQMQSSASTAQQQSPEKKQSVFTTIAPYYNTPVTKENFNEVKQKVEKDFTEKAKQIADSIGVKLLNIHTNIGGFEFSEGEAAGQQIRELSYTFELDTDDLEKASLFAALMGDLGYEQQEASIAAKYVDDSEANATEFSIYVKNLAGLGALLKQTGITDFTIDLQGKCVKLLAFSGETAEETKENIEKLREQLTNLINILGDNYERTDNSPIKSNYLDKSSRRDAYEQWNQEHQQGEKDRELSSYIEQAIAVLDTLEQPASAQQSDAQAQQNRAIAEQLVVQDPPEAGSNPADTRNSVLVSPNEKSAIYKLRSKLNAQQLRDRNQQIAQVVSDTITAVLEDTIDALVERASTETDPQKKSALLKKINRYSNSDTGRTSAIAEIWPEVRQQVFDYFNDTYQAIQNLSDAEIASRYAVDNGAYFKEHYGIIIDNFDTLLQLASPILEMKEGFKIVSNRNGQAVFKKENPSDVDGGISNTIGINEGDKSDGDLATGNEGFRTEARKVDPHTTIRGVVRRALTGIRVRRRNADGTITNVTDDLGQYKTYNESAIYTALLNEFAKTVHSPEDFARVVSRKPLENGRTEVTYEFPALEALRDRYMWVDELIDRLSENPSLVAAFYGNTRVEYTQVDTHIITDDLDANGEPTGKRSWKTKHQNAAVAEQCVLDKAEQTYRERQVLEKDTMLWDTSGNVNHSHIQSLRGLEQYIYNGQNKKVLDVKELSRAMSQLLGSIGIETSPAQMELLFALKDAGNTDALVSSIINCTETIIKEAERLSPNHSLIVAAESAYRGIANIIGVVDEKYNTLMFHQGDGDRPSYTPPNFLEMMFNGIKDGNESQQRTFMEQEFGYDGFLFDFDNNRFRNPMMQMLYESKSVRENLQLVYTNMLKNSKGEDIEYKDWEPQDIAEHFIFRYMSALDVRERGIGVRHYAYYNFPIVSDSAMAIFVKLPRYTEDYVDKVNTDCVELVKQELMRMALIQRRKAAGAVEMGNFDKNGKSFLFFPYLNDHRVEANGIEMPFKDYILTVPAGPQRDEAIKREVAVVNNKAFNDFMEKYSNTSLLAEPNASAERKLEVLGEYFYNNMLAQATLIQMATTDLAYYKQGDNIYTDFQKRNKESYASGPRLFTESEYGRKYERSVYLSDAVVTSRSWQAAKTCLDKAVAAHEMSEAQRDDILNALQKINSTDAQAFRSLDSMRAILDMKGMWSDEMAASYDRMTKGQWSYEDFYTVWGTIKPFLYGTTSVADGLGGHMRSPVQHKDSEYVLLAFAGAMMQDNQTAESATIRGLNRAMQDFQLDKAIYESGVKAGCQGTIDISYSRKALAKEYNKPFTKKVGETVREFTIESLLQEKNEEAKKNGKGITDYSKVSMNRKYKEALDYGLSKGYYNQDFYNSKIDAIAPQGPEGEQEIYDLIAEAIQGPKDSDGNHYTPYEEYQKKHPEYASMEASDFIAEMERLVSTGEITTDEYEAIMKEAKPAWVYEDFTDEHGNTRKENVNVVHTIPYNYSMEAQPTTNHLVDSESVFGSQFRNVLLHDLNPNSTFTIKTRSGDKTFTRDQLIDLYQRCIVENLLENFEELQKEFSDIESLQEHLLSMVQGNSSYGQELVDALQLVTIEGKKQFNIPFHNPSICVKMEQLVLSAFKSGVTKQKIRGAACVLVTDHGHNLEVLRNPDTGAITGFECYMPASTEQMFAPFLVDAVNKDGVVVGKKIDYDRIKNNPELRELLEGVGFRIPTEAKYSMAHLVIKGFLPQQNGAAIMMPAECTTLAGWDFDVDKLFIALKEFETYKAKNNKGEEYDKFRVVQYDLEKPVEQQSRAARNNMIIDIARTVLSHPNVASRITRPGNFKKLGEEADRSLVLREHMVDWGVAEGIITKEQSLEGPISSPIAQQIVNSIIKASPKQIQEFLREYSPIVNPLSLDTFIHYHNQNMAGGKLIGIYANNNTSQAKYQQSDLGVTPAYQFTINGHRVQSLSEQSRTLQDGSKMYLSDNCAEFLAASADNVKDPKLAKLMQSPDTAFITGTMLRAGLSIPEIALFFSHPWFQTNAYTFQESYAQYFGGVTQDRDTVVDSNGNMIEIPRVTSESLGLAITAAQKLEGMIQKSGGKASIASLLQDNALSSEERDALIGYCSVFSRILDVAPEVRTLTQISRADSPNGAISNTLAGAVAQVMKLKDFHARQRKVKILTGTERLVRTVDYALNTRRVPGAHTYTSTRGATREDFRNYFFNGSHAMPMLEAFQVLGIQAPLEEAARYFKLVNSEVLASIDANLRIPNANPYLSDALIDKYLKGLTMYALTSSDIFNKNTEQERAEYIVEYPVEFFKLKQHSALTKYEVIRAMEKVKNAGDFTGAIGIPNIQRRRGVADEFRSQMSQMLFDTTPVGNGKTVRDVAIDLFKYSYYIDGLGHRVHGFSSLFDSFFLESLPEYMDAVRSWEFNGVTSDGFTLEGYTEQFTRREDVIKDLYPQKRNPLEGPPIVTFHSDSQGEYAIIRAGLLRNPKDLATGRYNRFVYPRVTTVLNQYGEEEKTITYELYEYESDLEDITTSGGYKDKNLKMRKLSTVSTKSPIYNANLSYSELEAEYDKSLKASRIKAARGTGQTTAQTTAKQSEAQSQLVSSREETTTAPNLELQESLQATVTQEMTPEEQAELNDRVEATVEHFKNEDQQNQEDMNQAGNTDVQRIIEESKENSGIERC